MLHHLYSQTCNRILRQSEAGAETERSKMREYKERIKQVEHGDFHPLDFTCTGGMAPQSHLVLKKLAEKEREAKHSIVCRFWLVALQAELCAATHNAAMCPSNSSQESVMRNEHRVGCRDYANGLLTTR